MLLKKLIVYVFLMCMLLFSIQTISAANITVHPGESIQNAVNGASDGDSITVYDNNNKSYSYNESVSINKKISIKASGNVTIKSKDSSSAVFVVNSGGSGSSIQNFALTNSSYCIMINNANSCTIKNNVISGASLVGIQFYGNVYNSQVIGNTITGVNPDGGNGISFEYGNVTSNTLTGNTISNFLNGIIFNDNSENNTVSNNRVSCTGYTGAGIYTTDNARGMIITGNTVTGAEDGIAVQQMGTNTPTKFNISGNTLTNNKNGFWICLSNSTISNNTATANLVSGLDITGRNNQILNNTASNNGNCGITLANYSDTDYNVVDGNNLSYNQAGINSASNYSNITGNWFSNNKMYGAIVTANHVKVGKNTFLYNDDGGILLIGTYNVVDSNVVNNSSIGIVLQSFGAADYNLIVNNTLNYNNNGINSGCNATNFYNNTLNYNNQTGLTITGSNCYVVGNSMCYNKEAGLTINGINNVVTTNRLENNLYGASFSNHNAATFNFNSVVGNTYQLYSPDTSGTLNATNNWWGSNSSPSKIYGLFNVNPWIVLKLVSSSNKIIIGCVSNITADLTWNSAGEDTDLLYAGIFVPDGLIVNFSCDSLGFLSNILLMTVNGTATTNFTGSSNGSSIISANVDDQNVSSIVTVLSGSSLNVNPINGHKGELVNLVATLKDGNNQPVNGKTIRFLVDGTLVGTAMTNSSGVATLSYTLSQDPGSYPVVAQFLGDGVFPACNGTAALIVSKIMIGTNITLQPVSGYIGDGVKFTATLHDSNGSPVAGKTVVFYINGTSIGSASTDSNGTANLFYTLSQSSGNYTIMAIFLQDNNYLTSNSTSSLQVNLKSTTITINPVTGYKGDRINLTATLKDTNGNPVTGKTINFYINGTPVGTDVTGPDGKGNYNYALTQISGIYTIMGIFSSDGFYVGSNGTNTLNITLMPTKITVNPITGYKGTDVNLTARLEDKNGLGLDKKPIYFSVNGVSLGSALTDEDGAAVLTVNLVSPGGGNLAPSENDDSYVVLAQFFEDGNYCSSQNSNNLIVKLIPSTISVDTVTGHCGSNLNLVATLRDNTNKPISGKTVCFYVEGVEVGDAQTDVNGVATWVYKVSQTVNINYNLMVKFLGDDDFNKTEATTLLEIIPEKTVLSLTPLSSYTCANTCLKASLYDEDGNCISDKLISFFVNGKLLGTTTTDSEGIGTLICAINSPGSYILSAQYTDGVDYSSSSDSKSWTVYLVSSKLIFKSMKSYYGDKLKLSATLLNTANNLVVSSRTVYFYVNGKLVGSGLTNASGIASYSYLVKNVAGSYSLRAEYKNDNLYSGSSYSTILTVQKIPTKILTYKVYGKKNYRVKLTATLTNIHTSTKLANASVRFYVSGKYVGSGKTNKYGVASFYYTTKLHRGTYTLTAKYMSNNIYLGSSNSNKFIVLK